MLEGEEMQAKNTTLIRFVSMLVLVLSIPLSACTAGFVSGETQIEAASDAIPYEDFTLPSPEEISFQLPENWDFWGNAGYLSPDDGETYAGVRLAWMEEGKDAEKLLYNEGSTVHEKTTVVIGDLETHRYIVEVTLTNASTGKVFSHTYEMIYAFPDPKREMMAGVVFSAPTREELEPLVPIAEHMVKSLKWGSTN
jgi:hypothetical protein